MRLTRDEQRALTFVALLLLLAAAVRVVHRPDPAQLDLAEVDVAQLETSARDDLAASQRRARALEPGEKIDPNTASADELQRLPGIGPAVAARIIADREASGPFATVSELTRVPGIGPATVQRLAPFVALPAAAGTAASRRPSGGSVAIPARGSQGDVASDDLVDVNAADAEQLTRLPGIGPAIAARIIAFRDTAGPFRSPADLERVPGIGPATLQRIMPHLKLSP